MEVTGVRLLKQMEGRLEINKTHRQSDIKHTPYSKYPLFSVGMMINPLLNKKVYHGHPVFLLFYFILFTPLNMWGFGVAAFLNGPAHFLRTSLGLELLALKWSPKPNVFFLSVHKGL